MSNQLRWLPIDTINPFDYHHCVSDVPPGFTIYGDKTQEHLEGALYAMQQIRAGKKLRPIAVCPMAKVNDHPDGRPDLMWQPDPSKKWQRLDGFKRYWGTKLAGFQTILCEVHEEYKPGVQHEMTMIVEDGEVGNVRAQLSSGTIDPSKMPFASRISIEDCETVHVHIGNMRLEYHWRDFIKIADHFREARNTLLKLRRG